jgi:hypothetical protein
VTAIILTAFVVAGLLVNGLRLRARVPPALTTVNASTADASTGPNSGQPGPDSAGLNSAGLNSAGLNSAGLNSGWTWITAREAMPDAATRREAVGYALGEGLEMLDLVPADLPATAARDLVRAVDPRACRADRLAIGRGAGVALVVAAAGIRAGRGRPAQRAGARRRDREPAAHPALHP